MKISALHVLPSNIRVESSRPLLIGPKDAPPQWIADLENWCCHASEKELPNRLEAAKYVLQQYANPQNKTLDLSNRELTSLPPGLWYLTNLQELNVSQNPGLQALPDDLSKCATLRSINASSCSINKWPKCLSKLPLLKTLQLDDNPRLCVFPDEIRKCHALKQLSMEATKPHHLLMSLSTIVPESTPRRWIADLENWCRNAPEKELPNRLEAAKYVLQQYANPQNKTLDLSNRELTSLPPGLWYLTNLQELNVSQNPGLQALPDDLSKCATLRSINASSCSINDWPKCLSKLPLLKTLQLNDNPVILRVLPDEIRECHALENLSMIATKPHHFEYPPSRLLPPGEARGRALMRSPSAPPQQSHGNFRTRSASPPAQASAPSVTTMLGSKRAYQLDEQFGSLQWPRSLPVPSLYPPSIPISIKSWEFDDDGKPLMQGDRIFVPDKKGRFPNLTALLDLEAIKTGEKQYIWAISKLGRLIIAEEKKIHDTPRKTLGHPTLVGGGRARIAGELWWHRGDPKDPSSEECFYIKNTSGRYSVYVDRDMAQLQSAAVLFLKAGLAIKILPPSGGARYPVSGLLAPALKEVIFPNNKAAPKV